MGLLARQTYVNIAKASELDHFYYLFNFCLLTVNITLTEVPKE
jgi:hypothetical protein